MTIWENRLKPGKIGLAVSGGGDSMAMLFLMKAWADESGREICVATVNHNLRDAAEDEVKMVQKTCEKLGVDCDILVWKGWKKKGNLQDAAREARNELIGKWAIEKSLIAVSTGHTADDQAETFLIRLARGSGVDGLSGMASKRVKNGLDWFRPLLSFRRENLRQYLKAKRIKWVDDPSNDDLRFDRIKMRKAQKALDGLGLTVDRLVETATRMSTARRGLERLTKHHAKICTEPTKLGTVKLDIKAFKELPLELRYRLFAHSLMWVSGAKYRPRFDALLESASKLSRGQDHTLLGCHIITDGKNAEICREVSAMKISKRPHLIYDGRWLATGPKRAGTEIRALGEKGLPLCEGWRDLGCSRVSLLGSPSIWHSGALISAPFAGIQGDWEIQLAESYHEFFTSLVTH